MSWAFLAITETVRRRLTIAALIAAAVALSLAIYLLGHEPTRSELCTPPLDELQETWLMNRPECLDAGSP